MNEEDEIDKTLSMDLCPRCMTKMRPVEVHGHLQCSVCKMVVADCCQGEQACNES